MEVLEHSWWVQLLQFHPNQKFFFGTILKDFWICLTLNTLASSSEGEIIQSGLRKEILQKFCLQQETRRICFDWDKTELCVWYDCLQLCLDWNRANSCVYKYLTIFSSVIFEIVMTKLYFFLSWVIGSSRKPRFVAKIFISLHGIWNQNFNTFLIASVIFRQIAERFVDEKPTALQGKLKQKLNCFSESAEL